MIIHSRPSPNFGERPIAPDTVILHYTGMENSFLSLDRLCDPVAEVSAHFLIDERGEIFALVHPDKRAWHAGVSKWQGRENANDWSVGIELQNLGHEHGYQPFPQRQIDSLLRLLSSVSDDYAIPRQNYLGHSDIAPSRKSDPGELFPWARLAAEGFGVWPSMDEVLLDIKAGDQLTALDELLIAVGYDYGATASSAEKKEIITAFQRHWLQSDVTGEASDRTLMRAQQVAASFQRYRDMPPETSHR